MPLLPPTVSLPDPEIEGEGSVDPLSLSATYERLASRVFPVVTVRMSRPRFVTTIAIGDRVCQGLDEFAMDGQTPTWVVVE